MIVTFSINNDDYFSAKQKPSKLSCVEAGKESAEVKPKEAVAEAQSIQVKMTYAEALGCSSGDNSQLKPPARKSSGISHYFLLWYLVVTTN